ncbi:MAE_28990/MAE_18760 family HEPN-like nuclease [Comamonas terrigena]|uniref:MAE_28990/MAE_18760 family HEPN-like nuclease n=1 Tax=Comamonas terrigena TaxID=32013 RepID=UPI0028A012E0|nr:MAE_28990/MAE_18760 family HEPN-like nuclease [Comamonas terrigena]
MPTEASKSHLLARQKEINSYLDFLSAALSKNAKLVHQDGEFLLDLEVTHALKSNAYLLLYSAIESTMVQLMEEVHDVIEATEAELDRMHPSLYIYILRSLKTTKSDFYEKDFPLPSGKSIVSFWLQDYKKKVSVSKAHPLFNGNVDSQTIVKIAKDYGFCPQDDASIRNSSLLKAKEKRNILAHGSTSFTEMGRDLSFDQIRQDSENIMNNLSNLIQTVEGYLQNESFLAA